VAVTLVKVVRVFVLVVVVVVMTLQSGYVPITVPFG
jgi:hypothetical protein